jgi:GNAT superfamily N-acetyltransferase
VRVIKSVYDEYNWTWDPKDYLADIYNIPRHYPPEEGGFYVAEHEGEVQGVIGLHVFKPIPGPAKTVVTHQGRRRIARSDCELHRLYVLASTRGNGLGTALTERVIEEARKHGCKQMEIWSDKVLHEAHRLYHRFGATTVGERLCHDPDQSPEWGMALPLT